MIRWLATLLLLLADSPALADELRPGYIDFAEVEPGTWQLVWKAPVKGGLTRNTRVALPSNCEPSGEPTREFSGPFVIARLTARCTGSLEGKQIGIAGLAASRIDTVVRVAPLAEPVQTLRLSAAEPLASIASALSRWQVAQVYTIIGIEHIVFGLDHLLFVVALVILLNGTWFIIRAVTAFTVAHSITLAGSTLGLLDLPQDPVEIVIALSIVFLAVEIAKRVPSHPRLSERSPWVIAFIFGLLHGFGFAGALREIGLPAGEVSTALFTFNIGVEIGQLAIVLVTVAIFAATRRLLPNFEKNLIRATTLCIGSIASFWLIERLVT
jgi:hydrogenase/urease accessory protein HupE